MLFLVKIQINLKQPAVFGCVFGSHQSIHKSWSLQLEVLNQRMWCWLYECDSLPSSLVLARNLPKSTPKLGSMYGIPVLPLPQHAVCSHSFGVEDLGKQIHKSQQHIAALHFGSLSHDVFVLGKEVVTKKPFFRGRVCFCLPMEINTMKWSIQECEGQLREHTLLAYTLGLRRFDKKGWSKGWMNAMWIKEISFTGLSHGLSANTVIPSHNDFENWHHLQGPRLWLWIKLGTSPTGI